MCGICGKKAFNPLERIESELVDRMMEKMDHRGPDGRGKHLSGPVGLGHVRLAIIDLQSGAQPMTNEDGTLWLVFNGEIYNFHELRDELIGKGHQFASASDTEVIIHLYEEYGADCVKRLRGMFAFALWDEPRQTLTLARDRVGIKPLYFANTGRSIVFASEIKSILCDPEVQRELDPQAIDRFLTFLYLPGEGTMFRGIRKLEPGNYLQVKGEQILETCYWDLQSTPDPQWNDFEDASAYLEQLVQASVQSHLLSDVPVGVLLSGGVDSTTVLSCVAQQATQQVQTFTIGFAGEEFDDERPFARLAANRFATDHHEITISPAEFSAHLPAYVWHMEEPVCEAPAIALHYVSKLAARHVKVVLSGEGGDEAFAGYSNYRNLQWFEGLKRLAGNYSNLLEKALNLGAAVPGLARLAKYGPLVQVPLAEHYLSRTASPCSYFNRQRDSLYTSSFKNQISGSNPGALLKRLFKKIESEPILNQMLYVDLKTWLPDDLLIKADKITMANSIELRVPLLDHGVLEFAASLPPSFKIKGLTTKRILKHAFRGRLPKKIIKRRKVGLPVPLRKWMQSDLGAQVKEILLDPQSLRRGYFERRAIEQLLEQNAKSGALMKEVFALLTLELWHVHFADASVFTQRTANHPMAIGPH